MINRIIDVLSPEIFSDKSKKIVRPCPSKGVSPRRVRIRLPRVALPFKERSPLEPRRRP